MTTTKATAKNIEAGSQILLVRASNGSMVKAGTESEIKRATRATVTGVEFDGRYHRVITKEFGPLDWANAQTVYRFAEVAEVKGQSYTTGMVHRAVRRDGHLVPACGMSRRRLAYLAPASSDAIVTCRRC